MNILIDIDNVVVDFVTSMIAYFNIKYDKKFKASDVVCWDFVDSPKIDITLEQFYAAYDDFQSLQLWHKIPIYPDSKEVLDRLFKNHNVVYLSSRPASAADETTLYFQKHGLPFNGLQVLESESQKVMCGNIAFCEGMNKGVIAKNWMVDIVVEDRPSTIQNYIDEGIMVVRKEEPYNDVEYTGNEELLKSCANLTEFESIVSSLNEEK